MTFWTSLVVAACIILGASSSLAQPADEDKRRAAETFRQAEAAFARGEYAGAAAGFEEAGRFVPHPKTFLNAAEAWELAGLPARAAQACERALGMTDVPAALRDEARRRLDSLSPKVMRLEIKGAEGARVRIDGSNAEALPVARYLEPGPHRVETTEAGAGEARVTTLEGRAGQTVKLDVGPKAKIDGDLGPLPQPPAGGGEERPLVPVGTWVCLGIAGAAGVATGVLGGLTLSKQSAFESEPTRDNADTFYTYRTATNVTIGVVGAAVLAGAIVWIVDAATAPVEVKAAVGPTGGFLGVGAAF